MSEDYDKIAKIEKAIKQKYGEEAIKNPLSGWSEEKERDYIEQIKEVSKIEKSRATTEKEYYSGFLIDKKLLTKYSDRSCPVCETYSFIASDSIYFTKWDCCRACYVEWVEDREDRWKMGWRPGSGDENVNRKG